MQGRNTRELQSCGGYELQQRTPMLTFLMSFHWRLPFHIKFLPEITSWTETYPIRDTVVPLPQISSKILWHHKACSKSVSTIQGLHQKKKTLLGSHECSHMRHAYDLLTKGNIYMRFSANLTKNFSLLTFKIPFYCWIITAKHPCRILTVWVFLLKAPQRGYSKTLSTNGIMRHN